MMSLYGRYIREREDGHMLEENDYFVIYLFQKEGIYVRDIYVIPEKRNTGLIKKAHNKIVEITKANDLRYIYGSVNIDTAGPEISMQLMFSLGFRVFKLDERLSMIYLVKDLKEEE